MKSSIRSLAALLVAFVSFTARADGPAAPAAAPGAPDSALPPLPKFEDKVAYAKIHSGVILTEATDNEGHGGKVHGWAICHCKIEALWQVLTDHKPFAEFVPRVKSVEVSRRTDRGERAVQTIDVSISKVTYGLDYTWDPATRHIEFHMSQDIPHDLTSVDGTWQLWPIDHGANTLLDYTSAVDTGRQIPGFIRDYLADRGVKDTMDAMRKRAESLPNAH